jgi:GDSL-like Lipase/Acylhydrolase family
VLLHSRSLTIRRGEVLLLVGSLSVATLVLELSFRIASYLRHRASFEGAAGRSADVPARRAGLGNLLKPSRNPRIVYELRPDLDLKMPIRGVPDTRFHTSAQGFRDDDYALAKPPGTFRIVGLGDSLMFGWGVPQGRDYLGIVERRLNRDHAERPWEVINTAVPGYNTVMELETLRSRALPYGPDLVIVGYCGNDLDLPNFIWNDEPYLSLRTSFIARFVRQRLGRRASPEAAEEEGALRAAPLHANGGFEGDPARVPERYRDLVGWDAFAGALREMRDLGQRHGFRVALLVFVAGGDGWRPRVVETARALGIGIIDVGSAQERYMKEHGIAQFDGSVLTLTAEDLHPSLLSHRIAADTILEWMAHEGIVKPDGAPPRPEPTDD